MNRDVVCVEVLGSLCKQVRLYEVLERLLLLLMLMVVLHWAH
jgi:hypothetical protein